MDVISSQFMTFSTVTDSEETPIRGHRPRDFFTGLRPAYQQHALGTIGDYGDYARSLPQL